MTLSETAEFDPRDQMQFVFHATPLRRFVVWALRLLFWPIMKLEVRGLEHVPADGALIVACNHNTNWDVIPMQLALPRTIFFMGKAELFAFAPLDAVFRNCGAFPVRRGEKDAWAMRHAGRVLEHGQTLGMFPEGHRSQGAGLRTAKTGTARLAMQSHRPVLPMAITGTDRFFRAFPRRTPVTIVLLPPLYAGSDEDPQAFTDRLMCAIASALPSELRGAYAERRC